VDLGREMAQLIAKKDREYWQQNPVEWIETFLGPKLWSKQKEIVESVRDNERTTVRSGHGVGKSFVVACIMLWYLFVNPYSKIVSTAPSFRQVRNILWVEIAKLHKKLKERIDPAGILTQVELRLDDGWRAWGLSTDDPNSFIGAHEKNLLAVFDEACGISRSIFDAAEGILTAKDNKAILIGNPTDPGTFFHETHTGDAPGYHKIKISVFDCPNIINVNGKWQDNFDENGNLPYPELTSLKWVNSMRRMYSEKSAFWSSKVLGEFPTVGVDGLFDGRWLAAAAQKGDFLRRTIEKLEEGREILSSEDVIRIVGRK
jgi:phage terminase large subunit